MDARQINLKNIDKIIKCTDNIGKFWSPVFYYVHRFCRLLKMPRFYVLIKIKTKRISRFFTMFTAIKHFGVLWWCICLSLSKSVWGEVDRAIFSWSFYILFHFVFSCLFSASWNRYKPIKEIIMFLKKGKLLKSNWQWKYGD